MEHTSWAAEQCQRAQCVEIPPAGAGYCPQPGDLLFSLDAQYVDDQATVAVDVQRWQGVHLGTYVDDVEVTVPYVSGFFCFREGPPLVAVLRRIAAHLELQPDLILVDGHGIAHPRRFGLACWVGVETGIPTVGCAKRTLLRYEGTVGQRRGDCLWITDQGERVGAMLVTQDHVRPVFVSPGHKVSLETAVDIVLGLTLHGRLPEPLQRADRAARQRMK